MAKQIINIGSQANDRSGDPLRTAFNKINQNFTELYTTASLDIQIPVQTGNVGKYLTTNGSVLSWSTVTGGGGLTGWTVDTNNDLVPDTDILQDIGTPTNRVRHVYVGPGSVYIGNSVITESATGSLVLPGVTRATGYYADGIEHKDRWGSNPTITGSVTVIDASRYRIISGQVQASGNYEPAIYTVQKDGNRVDEVDIDENGTGWTKTEADYARDNNMYATNVAGAINTFNVSDWVQIPFRVEVKAEDTVYEDIFGNGGGLSITDFGRGFVNTLDDGKITTNKLYNRPANQGLNNHFVLEVTNGGVVVLPDQSIINGATLKTVPGNYAGITAGPVGKDEDSWVYVDNDGAWIATKYSTDAFTWHFDNTGKLVLPVGGDIVASDGVTSVLGGGGGSGDRLTNGDYQVVLGSSGNITLPKSNTITLPVSTDEDRYGGDINIIGQRGYGDWSTEGYAGWGSSIYIRSGHGGENSISDHGGEGGEVEIRSGNGQAGENGGKVSLIAGDAKHNNSDSPVYGGEARVRAGDAIDNTSGLGHGGNVNITAGQGDQANGVVNITTQNSDNTDNIWTFAGSVLNLPSTSDIKRGGISVLLSELEIDGGNANTPELGELIIDGNNGA